MNTLSFLLPLVLIVAPTFIAANPSAVTASSLSADSLPPGEGAPSQTLDRTPSQLASGISPDLRGPISDLDVCTCGVKAELFDGAQPAQDHIVPGCGACVGIFVEVLNKKKGFCRGVAGCPEGVSDKCKGDLRVAITTSLMPCCVAAYPSGWQPSWGAGNLLWGESAEKIWEGLEAACNNSVAQDFSITLKKIAPNQNTVISRTAKLTCKPCGQSSDD
jgi:hypothetical protein